MSDKFDLYDILGIDPDATVDQIKKAYRKKSKDCHPDLFPDDEAKAKEFSDLKAAYELLMDEDRRAKYDETGESIEEPVDNIYTLAVNDLSTLIMSTIDEAINNYASGNFQLKKHPKEVDIMSSVRKQLVSKGIPLAEKTIKEAKEQNVLLYDIRKRFRSKKKAIIEKPLDRKINANKETIKNAEEKLLVMKKMIEISHDIEFDWEDPYAGFNDGTQEKLKKPQLMVSHAPNEDPLA